MTGDLPPARRRSAGVVWRVGWTVATLLVSQVVVCGLALVPLAWAWSWLVPATAGHRLGRVVILSLAAAPSYAVFAVGLMILSAACTRLTGWRSRPGLEMRIAEMGWPLLDWARYMAAIHLVRVLAGTVFRGSPVWTMYLRLNGARIGRGVYVNSLGVSDHSLLEFGDDVVIGADAHVSGHTVERGLVMTAPVRLGARVTVGIASIVDIGVEAGPDCEVGALSFVPKYSRLDGHAVYAGVPAHRIG